MWGAYGFEIAEARAIISHGAPTRRPDLKSHNPPLKRRGLGVVGRSRMALGDIDAS